MKFVFTGNNYLHFMYGYNFNVVLLKMCTAENFHNFTNKIKTPQIKNENK